MVVVLVKAGGIKVVYPRRYLKTWKQLAIQSAAIALILQAPLVWRLSGEPLVIALALGGIALSALSLCVHGLAFLLRQEAQHPQPTPEMNFVFRLVAVYPLAIGVFLLLLLAEM